MIEKTPGATIEITIGDIGSTPKRVTAPINSQPKKFGKANMAHFDRA